MPQRINHEYGSEVYHIWDVPEYAKHPHSHVWYFGASVFFVVCILYAIYTANYLFAIILLLVAVVFVFHELREPAVTQFGITDEGVVWRGFLFPYKDVRAFWILYEPPEIQNIYIDFKRPTLPRLVIPLKDENPVSVRETLLKYIPEDLTQEEEPIRDSLGRLFKI